MRSAASAFRSVRVIASCPTTASNVCGRHFRASTWYVMLIRETWGKWPCTLLRPPRPAISSQSLLQSGTPTAHGRGALPLLPSGPGGVRRFSLRGAQPSTPPHEAHSTRLALGREFNPAGADCGLQGTATSPSSTTTSRVYPAIESSHFETGGRTRWGASGG